MSAAAAIIIIRIKRVFAFLRERGATSPDTAIPTSEVPYADRWYFRRVVKRGAVREHEGRCYLDEAVAQQYLQSRRTRALAFAGVALLIFVLYLWLAT